MAETDLTKTVASHYNDLKETGLEVRNQSRIYHLRNFNNWTKSMLINEYLTELKKRHSDSRSLTVLDLCAGKGGDLLKWKKGEISSLVCADIAATSVKQSEDRYNELLQKSQSDRFPSKVFSAEFITADCTKERLSELYKDKNMTFDLVSCQFSFHYCFESRAQAEMMIKNACENIKPGGYFIGTTPNSNEIIKRLRAAESSSFGNEVYRISFPDESKEEFALFGAKYDFHLEGVVDCPEFLVYFPAFQKIAEKYGMTLVFKKTFAEVFEKYSKTSDGRLLLSKMQGLETYPADRHTELVSKLDNDYAASQARLSELTDGQSNRQVKVGTLSKSEWEAATLYLAFAFKKSGGETEESTAAEEGATAGPAAADVRQLKRTRNPSRDEDEESPSKKSTAAEEGATAGPAAADVRQLKRAHSPRRDEDEESPSKKSREPEQS